MKSLIDLIRKKSRSMFKGSSDSTPDLSSIPAALIDDPEAVLDFRELQAIGRITVQMAALELDLMRFLSVLLFKNPNAGISVFLGLNVKTLIEMLSHTFHLKVQGSPYDDDIVSLISALEKISEERNSIAHGQWHYDNVQHRILKTRTRKGKRKNKEQLHYLQTEKTSAVALDQFADIVILARRVLVRFYQKLLREKLVGD